MCLRSLKLSHIFLPIFHTLTSARSPLAHQSFGSSPWFKQLLSAFYIKWYLIIKKYSSEPTHLGTNLYRKICTSMLPSPKILVRMGSDNTVRVVSTTATPSVKEIQDENIVFFPFFIWKVWVRMTNMTETMTNWSGTNSLHFQPKKAAHSLLRLHRGGNRRWCRIWYTKEIYNWYYWYVCNCISFI